jgi:hypothetical protein
MVTKKLYFLSFEMFDFFNVSIYTNISNEK